MALTPISGEITAQPLNDNLSYLNERKNDLAINVKDHGAKGDKIADDTSAIQSAFTSAFENGGTVFFPPGNYKVTSPILYRPYVQVMGSGKKSIIYSYVSNDFVFKFDVANEATGPHGVTIRELLIDGTNHIGTGGGISVTSSGHAMSIEKIWVINFSATGQIGIYGYGDLYYFYIKNCNIQTTNVSIKFDGTTGGVNNCTIENCKLTTGEIGIYLISAPVTLIKGCTIEGFTNSGIIADASKYSKVDTCWLEQNELYDIRVTSDYFNIDNIYTWRSAGDANYSVNFAGCSHSKVRNSYFNNRIGGNKPIWFNASVNCIADNCYMDDTGVIYTGALSNNLVIEMASTGISNRTEYPEFFFGGIYLSVTRPLNEQNGVIFGNATGLIKREDSIDKYIPALNQKHVSRSAAPTTGTWAVGDVAWNTAPTASGKIGWVCTTAGTPGVWKAWGVIDA